MSNLRLINETTVSSAVSSITADNLFTSDFDIYKVVFTAEAVSLTGTNVRLVNSSGSVVTSSNYDKVIWIGRANAAFTSSTNANADTMQYYGGQYDTTGGSLTHYIFNPTNTSSYTFLLGQGSATDGGQGRVYKQMATLKQLSSITGMNFSFNDANVDVANIRTYGLRVD